MFNFIKRLFFGNVKDTSHTGTVDKIDIYKLLRNAIIYTIGMLLTYLSEHIINVDFGSWTPMVIIIVSGAIDGIRKLLKDNGYVEVETKQN